MYTLLALNCTQVCLGNILRSETTATPSHQTFVLMSVNVRYHIFTDLADWRGYYWVKKFCKIDRLITFVAD